MKIEIQEDARDCGIFVLKSLYSHLFKKTISVNYLKLYANYGEKGLNITNFINLGKIIGIEMGAYKIPFFKLKQMFLKQYLVCLLNIDNTMHYAIVKIKLNSVVILESAKGKYTINHEEFKKIFTNIIITFKKKKKKSKIKKISYLILFKFNISSPIIISIFIMLLINMIFTFVSSIFIKILIEKIIPGKLNKTLLITFLGFLWIVILRTFNFAIKNIFLKKIFNKILYNLKHYFFNKMVKSKTKELLKITKNDLIHRYHLIEPVSFFIANFIFIIFNQSLMLLISSALLIWIHFKMFLIVFISSCFIFCISFIFQYLINLEYKKYLIKNLNHLASSIDFINLIKKIKISNNFSFINNKWKEDFYKFLKQDFSIWKMDNFSDSLLMFLNLAISTIVLFFGGREILNNNLSIANLLIFTAFASHFNNSVSSMGKFLIEYKKNKKNMEIINFLFLFNEEKEGRISIDKIKSINIENLVFSYDKPLFKIHKIEIKDNLHIFGKNGSGKTTFLKLIALIFDAGNQIKINNITGNNINKQHFRKRVFFASSELYFPKDTIFSYVTMNDKKAQETFIKNIKKYNLISFLNNAKIDLNLTIADNGHNLSSGQRQIIYLMRLFAFKYNLVIIDEGIENIDQKKLEFLAPKILQFQDALFVEVSHSQKYIAQGKRINIESIFKNI